MSGKTELSLLEKQGWIEPMLRVFLEEHPRLKKAAKQLRNKRAQGESAPAAAPDPAALAAYRQRLDEIIRPGDLVLIHSSMDGLEKLGFSAEDCLAFLKAQVEAKACTVVMACFPITNLKLPTEKSRPYDPKKTLCWTGLLPNVFLADPACVRSSFPYNSLAAIGPEAENMMARSLEGESVYHPGSPWRYCYERRAKILFLGVKASCQIFGQDVAHVGVQLLGVGVGGECVQVGNEVITVILALVLHLHKVTQRSQVVAQMQLPRGTYSTQNNLFVIHILIPVIFISQATKVVQSFKF